MTMTLGVSLAGRRAVLVGGGAVTARRLTRFIAEGAHVVVVAPELSPEVRAMVDEEKFRIWRVYLAGCAHAFENDDVAIYQIVGRKAGRAAKTLPWSRRYMYPGEQGWLAA